MRSTLSRTLGSCLVIIAVMLSVLALGAPAADAVEAGPVCETGTLTADNRCEIPGESGEGQVCPAIEDGDECYELVPAVEFCPDDFGLVGGNCILPVPDVPGPLQCEPPSELSEDDRCVTQVDPVEELVCAQGLYEEVFESCIDDFGAAEVPLVCPALEDDDGCYSLDVPVESCPDGSVEVGDACFTPVPPVPGDPVCPVPGFNVTVELDDGLHCGLRTAVSVDCGDNESAFHIGNGVCRETTDYAEDPCAAYLDEVQYSLRLRSGTCYDVVEDPPVFGAVCPEGSRGVPGGCYILVAPNRSTCVEGTLVGPTCVIVGDPPVEGPSTCPLSATVFQDGGECYTLIAPVGGSCPPATSPDPGGTNCRRPVDLRPGSLQCVDGFGIVDGECVRYEPPVPPSPLCPTGSVEDVAGDCRKPVADVLIDIDECPPGFELSGLFEACIRELGPSSPCPPGAEFDGEQCFRIFDGEINCPASFPDFFGFENGRVYCWNDYGLFITPFDCPAGSVPIVDGCGEQVESEITCPLGDLIDDDCRVPNEPEPGEPFCPQGDLIDGFTCLADYGPPEIVTSCPEGEDLGETCEIEGPAPTSEPTCGAAMGAPGACFIELPALSECAAGTTPNGDDETTCRLPVERIDGECGFGFGIEEDDVDQDDCVRYEEPLWFCAGQIVTINMTLGDPGVGTSGPDVILGTDGPDVINANGGNDLVCALAGDDTVNGGGGRDRIYGGDDNDTLNGNGGRDFIFGENGADTLNGNNGGDDLIGGPDNDTINGGRGRDSVQGGSGDDILNGNRGRDVLIGSSGNDQLFGGRGRDFLKAGAGIDTCDGQGAADLFRHCETIVDP